MGLTRGSAPGPQFAFELASFIMLSPRGWLRGSAPEPRFAFWLASFIMLSPREWLGGSAYGLRFAFELASFIMLSPRGWLGSSAPEPRFAFWLASFSSYRRVNGLRAVPLDPSSRLSWRVSSCCCRVNGLEETAFYLSLPLACLHDVNVEVSHGKLPHRIDKPCSLRYPIIMPYAKGGTPSCTLLPCCN